LQPNDLGKALEQAGQQSQNNESLATLAGGSAGDAIRLLNHDGLPLYAELIKVFDGLPNINRQAALRLADNCVGRGADVRFGMTLDLIDLFLSRAARAGLMGEPAAQGAMGEARLLARIAPDDRAARRWATLQQDLSNRSRHGRAVNLDPAALILDMIFKIEETAQGVAAA
jgi:DNA polymerase-3 subunit delta'